MKLSAPESGKKAPTLTDYYERDDEIKAPNTRWSAVIPNGNIV